MNLTICEINVNDQELLEKWDKFVDNSMEGTVFYKSYWLLSHSNTKMFRANQCKLYYVCDKNNEWLAAFAIPYKKVTFKNFIIMPYLTPYLGVMFKDLSKEKNYKKISIKKEINELVATFIKKWGTIIFYNMSPVHDDIQPFIWENFIPQVRYTYKLALNDMDKVWSGLEQKRRNDINRAKKSNNYVKWGFDENLDIFFELNKKTFERQNVKSYDFDLAKELITKANDDGKCSIGIVYDNNEPIGGCVLVWDDKRAYYLLGGINGKNSYSMSYLIWEAIVYTKNTIGLNEFDFEGSMVKSIENFFRKFGGNIHPYYMLGDKILLLKKLIK